MYLEVRKLKRGGESYRFSYDTPEGKRKRYPAALVPKFLTYDEADQWRRSQAAAMGARRAHIEQKLAWKNQHYEFTKLLSKFEQWQKERAPQSYANNVYYLEHWVLNYFLNIRRLNNVNVWHLYFQEFRDWLQGEARQVVKGKDKPLAAGTINNILRTVNVFLSFLQAYNLIDPDSVRKTPVLPPHKINRRTYKDIITSDELNSVVGHMDDEAVGEFLRVLFHTGMRFSELFGLPMTALFKGKVKSKSLEDELNRCGVDYIGYVLLESQPLHDDRRREADGSLKRKPLKSHREISPKFSRVIPIRSKEVWNILAKRWKLQNELHHSMDYGADKQNYVLFNDVEYNQAYRELRRGYEAAKLTPKGFHACRHSFTTNLVGETRSFFLTRMITGHRKDTSFERYLHIYEQIASEAEADEQEIELI